MTSVEMLQKRMTLWNQLKEVNQRQDDSGKMSSDDQAQWDKINAEIDDLTSAIERAKKVESLETEMAEARAKDVETVERAKKADITYRDVFKKFVKRQELTPEERTILQRGTDSQTVGTAEHGGRLVPDEWYNQITKHMAYYSGILQDANVITTSAGNTLYFPVVDETAVKGSLITETTGDTVSDVTWTLKQMDAYVYTSGLMKVSYELLQDNAYNIESHLQELAAERLGRIANEHLTTADGSDKPNGLMTAATTGKVAASTSAITRDEIVDLIHSVDIVYRQMGAKFQLNDSTLAAIKKLTVGTADDRPLWQPSIRDGEPDRIEGFAYTINNDIAELSDGVSSAVMVFGDISKYNVRMVRGMEWKLLTERYAETRQNGYFAFNRLDGELINTSAVKKLVLAAS